MYTRKRYRPNRRTEDMIFTYGARLMRSRW